MTRLLTSTLVLGASLAAALIGAAPSFAGEPTPKSVAVRPSGLVAPEIVITAIRERPQSAPVIVVTAKSSDKDASVVAENDQRPKS